jgi:hypothetical protein
MLELASRSNVAALLKYRRWSAWVVVDLSSVNRSGGFEQACQDLAAHSGARLPSEISEDVTVDCISMPMMSVSERVEMGSWASCWPGGTTPHKSSVQRSASQQALQLDNMAHATAKLTQQHKSQHVKNMKPLL